MSHTPAPQEFEALGAYLIAASTDTEECHLAWIKCVGCFPKHGITVRHLLSPCVTFYKPV